MAIDSIRAAQKAVFSPRVWPVLLALSGWAFSAVTFVNNTARKSDVEALAAKIDRQAAPPSAELCALHPELPSCTAALALAAARECLTSHEQTRLALRALVGQLARSKGRGAAGQENAQRDAETRYDRALSDAKTPAEAARSALQ